MHIMATERRNFTQDEIDHAWSKAKVVEGEDPNVWRKDYAGAWIKQSEYGNTGSQFGWEVDHVKPLEKNGTYDKSNLLPLQWENNRHKDDNYPAWETNRIASDSAERKSNVSKIQPWHIRK